MSPGKRFHGFISRGKQSYLPSKGFSLETSVIRVFFSSTISALDTVKSHFPLKIMKKNVIS